ncbi:MAG: CRP-like cAMP-binding protein [Roseivirga sp.]|jgi:CRP-like cAMP-binding protein
MNLIEQLHLNEKYCLDNVTKEVYLTKDEIIYQPGQATNSIYEVISGGIKLGSYGSQGQDITYDVLGNPDTFGNLKYLDGQFFEYAKTITSCRLRVYQLDFFKRIIVEDPAVSEWFNRSTVRRWSIAESRLLRIRSASSLERLQFMYNDLNRHIIDAEGKGHHLFSILTKQDIGDLTGMTRQTVSQMLKKLATTKLRKSA